MSQSAHSPTPILVAVVAEGPPLAPSTQSGVARSLYLALSQDPRVRIIAGVNAGPTRPKRWFVRLLSVRARKADWDRQSSFGLATPVIKAIHRWAYLTLKATPRSVAILHIRGLHLPSRRRYYAFIDSTISLRRRHWPLPGVQAPQYRSLERLERRYLARAMHVFTVAQYVADEVHDHYGVPSEQVTVVGAGLRHLPPPRTSAIRAADPGRVLFVGRDFDRKGGHLVVEAIAALLQADPARAIELHVVGCQVNDAPTWVVSHGIVSDEQELADMYGSAHVFCSPALFEPFGLAVLEAMSFGLPCIVSSWGAMQELVGAAGAGVCVAPNDVSAIERALRHLLDDPSARDRMGDRGRLVAAEFSWDRVAHRIVKQLERDLEPVPADAPLGSAPWT